MNIKADHLYILTTYIIYRQNNQRVQTELGLLLVQNHTAYLTLIMLLFCHSVPFTL